MYPAMQNTQTPIINYLNDGFGKRVQHLLNTQQIDYNMSAQLKMWWADNLNSIYTNVAGAGQSEINSAVLDNAIETFIGNGIQQMRNAMQSQNNNFGGNGPGIQYNNNWGNQFQQPQQQFNRGGFGGGSNLNFRPMAGRASAGMRPMVQQQSFDQTDFSSLYDTPSQTRQVPPNQNLQQTPQNVAQFDNRSYTATTAPNDQASQATEQLAAHAEFKKEPIQPDYRPFIIPNIDEKISGISHGGVHSTGLCKITKRSKFDDKENTLLLKHDDLEPTGKATWKRVTVDGIIKNDLEFLSTYGDVITKTGPTFVDVEYVRHKSFDVNYTAMKDLLDKLKAVQDSDIVDFPAIEVPGYENNASVKYLNGIIEALGQVPYKVGVVLNELFTQHINHMLKLSMHVDGTVGAYPEIDSIDDIPELLLLDKTSGFPALSQSNHPEFLLENLVDLFKSFIEDSRLLSLKEDAYQIVSSNTIWPDLGQKFTNKDFFNYDSASEDEKAAMDEEFEKSAIMVFPARILVTTINDKAFLAELATSNNNIVIKKNVDSMLTELIYQSQTGMRRKNITAYMQYDGSFVQIDTRITADNTLAIQIPKD